MDNIEILQKMIHNSNNIVAFTGAGCSTESGVPDFRSPDGIFNQNVRTNGNVSTESGIPDFRSVDGLYNQSYRYPPETIISHSFFERDPEEFYRFYKDRMLYLDAAPNAAHRKLAELERAGRLRAVITQNIDGLHQAAYWNSTAPSTATTALGAAGNLTPAMSRRRKAFPCATPAAGCSSRMWSSMRRRWTAILCTGR